MARLSDKLKRSAFLRMMHASPIFVIGIVICLFWFVMIIFAWNISPYNPLEQNFAQKLTAPSWQHLFGTDPLGRDILSRVLIGSRISILAAVQCIVIAAIIGVFYGGIAGYTGGIVDEVMMRIGELFMSFPTIILAIVIASALGGSLFNTLLTMSIVWWPNYARVMRSMVLQVKSNEYVEASKSLGASQFRIFFKEILPNSISTIIVLATVDFGNAILLFASLSYLGLGSPPPTPEWGAMVNDGVQHFYNWWVATFPGLAIMSVSLGANFVGDGVRDYMDPRLRKEI
jgi:peptide/nickel transport system permease protein